MHTTEQAKKLWCPMVRATSGTDEPGNAGNSPAFRTPTYARCIASQCAMWRWNTPAGGRYVSESPADFEARRTGYCGLAGTPAQT